MSIFTTFQIAAQGMTAQRERLETAAANLANSNTTRTSEGGAYRRRDVLLETVAVAQPSSTFDGAFDEAINDSQNIQSVRATVLVSPANTGVLRHQPNHPDADANGNVMMPDVDPLEETVNMLSAARAFEANASVFSTAKEMARASIKLGDS